jgi:hypothetical protein
LDFVEANGPKGDEEMMDSEIDTDEDENDDESFITMAESIRMKTKKLKRR